NPGGGDPLDVTIEDPPDCPIINEQIDLVSEVDDPNKHNKLTYTWTVTKDDEPYSLPEQTDPTRLSFTPTEEGIYEITLDVLDDKGNTGSDFVDISVIASRLPDVTLQEATGIEEVPLEGEPVDVFADVTDPCENNTSDETLSYSWVVTNGI